MQRADFDLYVKFGLFYFQIYKQVCEFQLKLNQKIVEEILLYFSGLYSQKA